MAAVSHFEKFKWPLSITQQRISDSSICLVLEWDSPDRRIEQRYFQFHQIQDGGRRPFWTVQMAISLQLVTWYTSCMYGPLLCPQHYTSLV